jgi:hypothetical protein
MQKKIMSPFASAASAILGLGLSLIPQSIQAQGQQQYTSFGGRYTPPIPARPVNFMGKPGDVLPRCQVFGGCTASRLVGGEAKPADRKVINQLRANGFKHKISKKGDRSFFIPIKNKK